MSTRGSSRRLCWLLMFATTVGHCEEFRGTVPADSHLQRSARLPAGSEVAVSGVLGYSADCGLSVYDSPHHAIVRDARHAVRLNGPAASVGLLIDERDLGKYIGRYVYIRGNVAAPRPDAASSLDAPKFSHLFEQKRWTLGKGCLSEPASERETRVQLTELLSNPAKYLGSTVTVTGIYRPDSAGGLSLFTDPTAADVASSANSVHLAVTKKNKDVRLPSSRAYGKYVTVVATVVRKRFNGATLVTLDNLQAIEVLAAPK